MKFRYLPIPKRAVRFINLTALIILSIYSIGAAQSSQADPMIQEDYQAKIAIMKSMIQSEKYWNEGNLEGFMHNYWRSDSLKFIGKSGITYGWNATLDRYKKSYPDKSKQGTLKFEFIHLDKISNDAFFQVGKYTLTRESDTLSGHFSLLWRKIDGEWRIVADHSS
jgi:hypothetical protein